jgi:hypothetical protein
MDSGPLWLNGQSTIAGLNDQVSIEDLPSQIGSLKLIKVNSIMLHVFSPGTAFGNPKRRVQGRFRLAGTSYHLWVTDPEIEREYLSKDNGQYPSGPSFLTISLGEPFNNYSQKLIAAVMRRG